MFVSAQLVLARAITPSVGVHQSCRTDRLFPATHNVMVCPQIASILGPMIIVQQ